MKRRLIGKWGRIPEGAESPAKAASKGLVLRYYLPSPLSRVKEATLVCHMAGTMKFSEVPPYPYTCRSLHRVRTGKMRDKTDLGFPTFAHAALFRMCCEIPAATKFESPKRSLLNGLKALGLAGICSLQSVTSENLRRCQTPFKLLFGSALPKSRSRSRHAIRKSSEANRIYASL